MTALPYPYLIFYEVTETEIVIHAVRYAARDPAGMWALPEPKEQPSRRRCCEPDHRYADRDRLWRGQPARAAQEDFP